MPLNLSLQLKHLDLSCTIKVKSLSRTSISATDVNYVCIIWTTCIHWGDSKLFHIKPSCSSFNSQTSRLPLNHQILVNFMLHHMLVLHVPSDTHLYTDVVEPPTHAAEEN